MAESRHYIKGVQSDEPTDWQNIEATLDFSKDKLEPTLSFDTLEFTGESAKSIISELESNGYYQGIQYRFEAGDLLDPALVFNGYLDPTQNVEIKACDIIQIALKREQGADWLVEMADSFSFRYLASTDYNGPGKIRNADFKGVPYIINYIPDGVQLLLLSISSVIIAKSLIDSIKDIAKQTTDLIEGATPTIGTSVGLGAGVVTAWPIGKIIGSVINLAIEVAFVVAQVVALVKLIEEIIEQLAPKKRFHLGMGIKDLALKACLHLGLTLESDLLDSLDGAEKWVIIPSKGHKGGSPPTGTDAGGWIELGVPNASDGVDTFGDLIRFIRTTWNADYKLVDGVLRIERADYWDTNSSYIIPNTYTNQEALRNEFTFNTDELKSNIVLVWDTDLQDQNTLDNQNGRVYQAITSVKNVQNPDLVNLKGLERIAIPMSMGIRKDKLTAVEEVLKVFLQAADFLSGQLDSPQSFAAQFSARVGSLHLSSHFTSRPKMVVMAGSKLATDQRNIMSAQRLWEEYHFLKSFVTINNKNNQQVLFKEQLIDFCPQDFVSLSGNNFATTEEGERAEITRVVWNIRNNSAIIDYNVFRVYDTNLEIKYNSI